MDDPLTPPEASRPPTSAHALAGDARRLQWLTIAWNVVEIFVTVGLGVTTGSLALVAFGLDSLVEVFASLVVVWHLQPVEAADDVAREKRALRLVAVAFAVLAAYLAVGSIRTFVAADRPDETYLGIAYLGATALVMFALARRKHRIAAGMGSEPLEAEASMTFLDGCLATGILAALAVNAAWGWWWADPLAALAVASVAAREAWEGWHSSA